MAKKESDWDILKRQIRERNEAFRNSPNGKAMKKNIDAGKGSFRF